MKELLEIEEQLKRILVQKNALRKSIADTNARIEIDGYIKGIEDAFKILRSYTAKTKSS